MPTNVRYWKHMKILRFIADREEEKLRTTTRHIRKAHKDIYPVRSTMNGALVKLSGMGVVSFEYRSDFFSGVKPVKPVMPHQGDLRVWNVTASGLQLLEKVDQLGVRGP